MLSGGVSLQLELGEAVAADVLDGVATGPVDLGEDAGVLKPYGEGDTEGDDTEGLLD